MSADDPRRPRPVGNPIRSIAARTRLRGALGPAVLVGWLVGLGTVVIASWLHVVGTGQLLRQPSVAPAEIGRAVGQWWILATSTGMLLAVPAVAAGAIAGAREHHTAIPWRVSLVPARRIVWGHALVGWAFVLLLAVTSLPFAALAWAMGGVGAAELGAGLASSVAIGLVVVCVTLAASALTGRTATALLLTYLVLTLVVAGSGAAHAAGDTPGGPRPVDAALLVNPLVAAADAAAATRPHARVARTATGHPVGTAEDPVTHLAALVHRGHHAAGPARAAWPTSLVGGLLVGLLALLTAVVGVRRRHLT